MDNLIKMNVTQGSQLQVDGLKALRNRLGVVDTLKFLAEYDNGGSVIYPVLLVYLEYLNTSYIEKPIRL